MLNRMLVFPAALCLFFSCCTSQITPFAGAADTLTYSIGDLNGDAVCNAADATEILIVSARIGAGEASGFASGQLNAADLDGNGTVNAADAAAELIFASDAGAGSKLTITDYVYQLRLPVSLAAIPEFSGEPYVVLHDGEPYFQTDDYDISTSFESYSEFDSLNRCQVCVANIGQDLMPTESRGEIGMVKPTGWHTVRYDGIVDGNYLYNRCHLIGFQLAGENANAQNLITGTRFLNVQGMLPFENQIADYVKSTGNHVLYRVTPMFAGDDLLAHGVLMEGYSVEDAGEGVTFCVYCYNVHPGIGIDYPTGDSWLEEDTPSETTLPRTTTAPAATTVQSVTTTVQTTAAASQTVPDSGSGLNYDPAIGITYVCNKSSMKFHRPDCTEISRIKEQNRMDVSNSRDAVISSGYTGCKKCNP